MENDNLVNSQNTSKENLKNILSIDDYLSSIKEFLSQRWWIYEWDLYHKWIQKTSTNHRTMIKPRKLMEIDDIKDSLDATFPDAKKENHLAIIHSDLDTFFVVSWIQSASNVLFGEKEYDNDWHLVHQPSIRMKYLDSVSWEDWIWVSFVNSTIYKIWSSFEEHLEGFDNIISFLSKMWMYAWNISLKVRDRSPIWDWRSMNNVIIDMYYGDLHIGDAVYIYNFQQETRDNLTISDIWIWCERIMYARNNFNNYFEQFWVDLERYTETEIEALKTLVLIYSEKLHNISGDQKNQIKKIYKKLNKNKNYYPLIIKSCEYREDYYDFDKKKILSTISNNLEDLWDCI